MVYILAFFFIQQMCVCVYIFGERRIHTLYCCPGLCFSHFPSNYLRLHITFSVRSVAIISYSHTKMSLSGYLFATLSACSRLLARWNHYYYICRSTPSTTGHMQPMSSENCNIYICIFLFVFRVIVCVCAQRAACVWYVLMSSRCFFDEIETHF